MNIIVRPACMSDVGTIRTFNAALASETEARVLDEQLLHEGVKTLLADSSKGWYAVAVNSSAAGLETIVGQILVTYEWSDWRNGHFWWIQSLYVDRHYRQRGVFRKLFGFVRQRASESPEQVCGFRLYVEGENHQAHQVYAHMGFQQTPYLIHEIDLTHATLSSPPSTE